MNDNTYELNKELRGLKNDRKMTERSIAFQQTEIANKLKGEMGKDMMDILNGNKKIEILKQDLPYGIEIEKVYYQPELVSTAINQFIINLIESVVVVVGVLLITMGIKSGLIIGSGLILSILGTLIAMVGMKIDLQRVSLGAFIVAMGMLVDNSIVVVDGVLDSLDSGNNKYYFCSYFIIE